MMDTLPRHMLQVWQAQALGTEIAHGAAYHLFRRRPQPPQCERKPGRLRRFLGLR
jgi:hypothetical protein